ncbi:MAG: TonB family protein [Bryobacteraceae bacterium]
MFDAIGVSEPTRKPWTVAVSLTGQVAMVGLAILIPMIGTEGLPHRLSWVSLPEPPRALPHHAAPAPGQRANHFVPPQLTPRGLLLPVRIPERAVILQDPEFGLAADQTIGVPGGFGDSNGPGGSVLDGLLGARTAPPPLPVQVAKQVTPPAPPKRIRMGGMVVPGKILSAPQPVYPVLARQARIEGTVRLEAVISRDGTILNLHAVSGHPLLIPAALEAVRHWVFRPTSLNGDPVEVATEIDVNFTLSK